MSLKNNPFYLLKLQCAASRREVVTAAEEMSFFLDASTCAEAQNTLINLPKRISAEMDWFIDVSKINLDSIFASIDNEEPIKTDGLHSLSRLNASLHNFSLSNEDSYGLGYCILDIAEQFSALDQDIIMELININREDAGLAGVQIHDVEAGLNKKRDTIRRIISDKLALLPDFSYIELITILADKYVADVDSNDDIILSDVIDQYEIRMQSKLEDTTEKLIAKIAHIKSLTDNATILKEIQILIGDIKQWDILAQPLQLKSKASGMPHKISEKLAFEVRDLSIFLNNERDLPREALSFVKAMQEVFSELGILSAMFDADSDALSQVIDGESDAKRIIAEMTALKDLSDRIKRHGLKIDIDDFIRRISNLDNCLRKTNVDEKTRLSLRESICLLARSTAVELHNSRLMTQSALDITRMLVNQFGDLPSLKTKLIQDLALLNSEANLSPNRSTTYTPSNTSNSRSGGCGLVPFLMCVLVAAICILPGYFDSSNSTGDSTSTPSYSSSSSSSSTVTAETRFSSSSLVGDEVYADIVSIFPEIGIYYEGSSNYSYFVCRCKTTSGTTVWINITTTQYRLYFDSSASTSIYSEYADEVSLSPSKRVHGTAKSAESVMTGLSSDTGRILIDFSSLD